MNSGTNSVYMIILNILETFQGALIEGGGVNVSGDVEDGDSGSTDAAVGEEGDWDVGRRSDRERRDRQVVFTCCRIKSVDTN